MATTIDGIPFMSGDEDNLLFGSLFPNGNLPPSISNSIQGIQSKRISNASPLTDVYFSKRENKEIKDLYFPNGQSTTKGNLTITEDAECKCPEDVIHCSDNFYYDDDKSGDFGDSKADPYAFTLHLYISKDKNKLEECATCAQPKETEILLFLEDNTGDVSGAYRSVKIGTTVRSTIRWYDTLPNQNNVDYVNQNLPKNSQLSSDELKQLIDNGFIENKALDLISFLLFINSFTSPIKAKVFKEIADFLAASIKFIDKNLKFKDYHWNPKAKKTKTEKDKNGDEQEVVDNDPNYKFSPILFPEITEILDSVNDEKINKVMADAFSNLQKQFVAQDQQILALFKQDIGVIIKRGKIEIDLVPDAFEKQLLSKYLDARAIITLVFDKLQELDFSDILKKGVNIVNAFLCGLWNGFVDAVNGMIMLLQAIFRAFEKFYKLRTNLKKELPDLLEQFDSFIQAFRAIDFGAIATHLLDNIKNLKLSSFQPEVVAYYAGSVVGTIVEMAVEIVIGILFTGGALSVEAVVKELINIFKSLGQLVTGAAKGAKKIVFKSAGLFKAGIEQLIKFLQQGTEAILKMIDDFFAWLKKVGEDIAKKVKSLFSKETKVDELFRDITKKFIIDGKGVLKEEQFLKIAGKIRKAFDVDLILIDRNSKEFANLFKKWYEDPIFAVFHESTFVNGRYGIELKGPAIYFFKGVSSKLPIELTAFTVQHELLHLKLWYKMVKEFPEMVELYNKIPNWLHEADVLGNFMKNPDKWNIAEIEYDLATLNKRINEYPEWKKSIKEIWGKEKVELEDLKNWNISNFLNKL